MIASLQSIKARFGGLFYVPRKYGAILYFEGPLTKWHRSKREWLFDEIDGLIREPHDLAMPEPNKQEVLAMREFGSRRAAHLWILWRLSGMAHCYGEVRPL